MDSTTSDDVREVVDALERAGIAASTRDGQLLVDDVTTPVEVKRMAVVTLAAARGLNPPRKGVAGVVIADRVSKEARSELAEKRWGWVDRRGHVRVWTPGLRVTSGFTPLRAAAPGERFASVFPPVGIEVALALLQDPDRQWSVKELAGVIERAAGGVSERLRALRNAGLVDRRNRPIVPELFWELVGAWHQRPVAIAGFPDLAGPFDQLSWLGIPADWVLTDTQAAVLLGAPVIASATGPPDFYVSDAVVDAAVAHFGPGRDQPAATIRPARYAGIHRLEPFRRTAGGFEIAHPVVVALDLAHDRARGREVVEAWDPGPLGVTRVW